MIASLTVEFLPRGKNFTVLSKVFNMIRNWSNNPRRFLDP